VVSDGSQPQPSPLRAVFFGPFGVRAGWRMALWTGRRAWLLVLLGSASRRRGVRPSFAAQVSVELAAALLAGWLLLGLVDRRPLGALGFAADPAARATRGIGLRLGMGAIGLAAGVLAVAGSARWVAEGGTVSEYVAALAGAFAFFAVAAAAEEALFRGYAFQALVQGIGAWPAVLLSSAAVRAGARPWNPNVDGGGAGQHLPGRGDAGVGVPAHPLALVRTALHLGWNWAMSALLDFPVSGLPRDTPLYDAVSRAGPRWFTGGDFGPEGGVAATLAIVAGSRCWLLRTRWVGESPEDARAAAAGGRPPGNGGGHVRRCGGPALLGSAGRWPRPLAACWCRC
jgi:membrane protease YdiL (CAAX protease family)